MGKKINLDSFFFFESESDSQRSLDLNLICSPSCH